MKAIYKILLIALISRITLFAVSIFSNHFFAYVNPDYMDVKAIDSFPFVGQFARWDSQIYMSIASKGYTPGYPDISSFPQLIGSENVPTLALPEWAFFPLYPAFVAAGATVFTPFLSGSHTLMLSGFLVSNVAFFVSVYFFYRLTEKLFKNPQIATVATIFYAFCGGAIFLSSVFTEGLFMALALGAFYYLEEGKLSNAVALGLLASLTRSDGFLVAVPFVIASILNVKVNGKLSLKLFLSSVLVSSGYLMFNLVGYFDAGHVFPIQVVAHNLNWVTYPPITQQIATVGMYVTPEIGRPNIFQGFYILSLALMCLPIAYLVVKRKVVWSLERETVKYWAFYGVMLYTIFMLSYLFSTVRYAIPLLPMYWVSARIYTANRKVGIPLLALIIALSIIGAYLLEISTPYFL